MSIGIRPLALTALLGAAGWCGLNNLLADSPPAKAGPKAAPVRFTNEIVVTRTAVTPKPLTDSVKKGLTYLVKNQQEDGGWNQGGGWRTGLNQSAGRIDGQNVEDPSDVGNTSVALLALIRAGNTPTEGEYKANVQKGLRFLFKRVEKSNKDDLYVTDVRNTQLQSKIGTYIDTFMANLVLAELKGKAGADEKRLIACLDKTMNKIIKHQTADGQFANNGGWAPVLSICMANKGIARAKQNGVQVDATYFARAAAQSQASAAGTARAIPPTVVAVAALPATALPSASAPVLDPKTPKRKPGDISKAPSVPLAKVPYIAAAPIAGSSATIFSGAGGAGGDAGVRLYSIAQGSSNLQDAVNAGKIDYEKARKVVADAKSTRKEKDEAEKKVQQFQVLEKQNGDVQAQLGQQIKSAQFVAGFGSNGGEEFLSFLNISETLVVKGGKEWEEWDGKMRKGMEKAQDQGGSWSGQHCITGKTFCTAGALLVMLADRTPFPADVLEKKEPKKTEPKPLPTPGVEKK